MESSSTAFGSTSTMELQNNMDELSLNSTLCAFCSSLETSLIVPGSAQLGDSTSSQWNTWRAVPRLDPKCKLCRFLLLAIPREFRDRDIEIAQHQKALAEKDTLLNSSEVVGLRVVPLRMVTDVSLQSLHTEQADCIPVVEINLCLSETVGDSSSGHLFPLKFLNCLIPNYEQFSHLQVVKTSQVDFELIKNWHDFCLKNHASGCGKIYSDLEVPNFKAIDCDEQRIVPYTKGPYLALSYVWGPPTTETQRFYRVNDQLEVVPPTIQDAINVTKALGFHYLWVDRYCIDQSQPIEVKEQVGMMDIIYEHAQMTIVAAAGEGPSYGLPGVSTRLRSPIATCTVKGLNLRALPENPIELTRCSKWIKRGWTYQEGLLQGDE